MREDTTEEQKADHKSFNDRDLEVTHFHGYHMLLVRSGLYAEPMFKGKELPSTSEERSIKKIYGPLFKLPLLAWIQLRSLETLTLEMIDVLNHQRFIRCEILKYIHTMSCYSAILSILSLNCVCCGI